ncbi:uncharacterized protein VTP21DRAFT_11482 [Calcarisporiella thermophila]|uniref:uncharacterized protein n=1 Tax=Calcarisporiella thermophila TaxID=911321 RepID=UPI0037439D71
MGSQISQLNKKAKSKCKSASSSSGIRAVSSSIIPGSSRRSIPAYLLPTKHDEKSILELRKRADHELMKKKLQRRGRDTEPEEERHKDSSGLKFREGRSYVEGQAYLFPIDEEDAIRLVHEYYTFRAILGCNFFAPIEERLRNGCKVLDVGCGPGLWLLDMAKEYPSSEFVGIDVHSLMFPKEIPPNCRFEVVDVLKPLPYADEEFHFVHQRNMMTAVPKENWQNVVKELARVTEVSGWLQLIEGDMGMEPIGPVTEQLLFKVCHAIMARGLDPHVGRSIDRLLSNCSTDALEFFCLSVPASDWGREVGQLLKQDVQMILATWRPWLAHVMGMEEAEYDNMASKFILELNEYRTTLSIYVAYARKTAPDSTAPVPAESQELARE